MATKRTGLGRGIGALIPTTSSDTQANRPVDVFFPDNQGTARKAAKDAATAAADAAAAAAEPQAPSSEATPSEGPQLVAVPGARLAYLSPALIVPNANQPRTVFDEDHLAELVTSIREVGVLQPIVVRPIPGDDEQYELIMGERRLRASKEVGLDRIPAIIKDTADEDMLRDALLENLHRSELNPLEEASAYQQLLADFGITQDELANRIGRSRPQISNTIRLLKLPAAVQQRVAAGVLSAGHARAILSLTDPEAQQRLADKIVNEDLSVRAAEAAAAQGVQAKKPRPIAGSRRGQLDEIADRLGDRLNTRVKVTLGAKKGQMVVEFATIADLNRILSELGESGFGQSS
ncbi:ParB/RepB/Spo0J family partition protein [Plantibacter sp. Leaf314]|uniref:ParB/RepB/Spo0J family partition protein n=1 Tax=Plantibacter sp. Leaf314 TaxID=1736333 RepID=UPI0006F93839|nr:ParB/RepB/Spo0J family partition protein [Plantibacter sp. Leaf314]KQQ52830.1 chromosome partitioning protein ParB [Plantibacter sp. Leaf314]